MGTLQIARMPDGGEGQSASSRLRGFFVELVWIGRPLLLFVFAAVFGLVAAFRTFGFDVVDGGVLTFYPEVADGWGFWSWLAKLHLYFYLFFFIVNCVLAAQIFLLAFPRKTEHYSIPISIVLLFYMVLWFLFGQSRYGMAVALIAPAVVGGGIAVFVLCGTLAFLVHKAVAGGIAVLLFWRVIRDWKYGLHVAVAMSISLSLIVITGAQRLLVLAGYEGYLNWSNLPAANTPLKFYWMIGVLLLWRFVSKERSNRLLILTLLLLPFTYFIVFAGRTFEMYSVVLLYSLLHRVTPRYVKVLLLIPYVADLILLLFSSGFYF